MLETSQRITINVHLQNYNIKSKQMIKLIHIVPGKQILGMGHGLELQCIP